MQRQRLYSEGLELSRLVWGAWRLLDQGGKSTAEIGELIAACLDLGITTFDHADIYGKYAVEEAFGEALKAIDRSRDRYELVTKCGIALVHPRRPEHRVKHYNSTADHIRSSVENSLRNLGSKPNLSIANSVSY
jgi:predicted oxidoreductase